MSQPPEPATGLYYDSSGTHYAATHEKRTGWWLRKLNGTAAAPFQKPDFSAAVMAGVFTFQPATI